MFGYVNIAKEELLVKEYNSFRSYYCGLCRELGRLFNQKVKLGLNYDMVFLALLLDSFSEQSPTAQPIFCVLHPLHKRYAYPPCPALSYAAFMSILLTYEKVQDDRQDEGVSLKTIGGGFCYHGAYRTAKTAYADTAETIHRHLAALSQLENQNCAVIDEVADEFGQIMQVLFTPDFIPQEAATPLSALAYQLGRWIYILDAFDDIASDCKQGTYNPLLVQYQFAPETESIDAFSRRAQLQIQESLDHTLAQMALLFDQIPFQKNKGILWNVFYLGLPSVQRRIIERKTSIHEQSLSGTGR